MRFKLYREHGALNSVTIFNAFEKGLKAIGHEIVTDDEEVAVIWSVLWAGRMAGNQAVYNKCQQQGIPVVIIEVGNLLRNVTWRISLNHINALGNFGNSENLDLHRPEKLGVSLQPLKENRKTEILIACQHQASLQWHGQTTMAKWVQDLVFKIQQVSPRKIVIRPHPRSTFYVDVPGAVIERPMRVPGTYDDFNIDYNYHAVINYNSGPAVQAAIQGVPVVCDSSSLAFPVSGKLENIENISLPDREEWFLKLCHTEWTMDEIAQGLPVLRLFP
jgi:hypothetical protein